MKKIKIELIYDIDCPNVDLMNERLFEACNKIQEEVDYFEWDRANPESPEYVKEYGSPTVLINGKDLVKSDPAGSKSCRVYQEDGKLSKVPSELTIIAAIEASHDNNQ